RRKVRVQVELKKAQMTAEEIDVLALRRKLNKSIRRLCTLQATYTPASIINLGARETPVDELPENVPLFLPSALSKAQRVVEPVKALAIIEDNVRDAQCGIALIRLRSQLYIKSRLLTYKKDHSRNQGANTRSRTLRRLGGGDPARVKWHLLRQEDIRCMQDAEEVLRGAENRRQQAARRAWHEANLRDQEELPPLAPGNQDGSDKEREVLGGENMREISWIWTAAGTSGMDQKLEEALCIEWCKAYVR
ncbi:hypothetical protein C8R44DRAFT_566275, partial [Mycena epipterygia]